MVGLTGGQLYGDRVEPSQHAAEFKLVADLYYRLGVLSDEQRAMVGVIREADRAHVALVREPDVIAFRRLPRHRQLVLHATVSNVPS